MPKEHRKPTSGTVKKLYAHALRCAHLDCNQPLYRQVVASGEQVLNSHVCHINARSELGPRWDAAQSEEQNRSGVNLLLMCFAHARDIDDPTLVDQYPAQLLHDWKKHQVTLHGYAIDGLEARKAMDDTFMMSAFEGLGGDGGSAEVFGDGVAIGGPAGQGGKYGRGGNGGSAKVHGNGLAAGGAGGAAGDDGIWRAPAKSGYEVAMRTLGLPVEPLMRQFGRGGAMLGYEPKFEIVEQLRHKYFVTHGLTPQGIFENIEAVPLNYINESLRELGEAWSTRIVDDEYEFFLPGY